MAKILAGPMLRRTEPGVAWIWCATDTAAEIRVTAYLDPGGESIGESRLDQQKQVPLGRNLFVHLMPLRPDEDTFPEDTPIYYDVTVGEQGLQALGLLDDGVSIAYPGEPLPSFFFPAGSRLERFAHGSCRKLHGPGIDAYRGLDTQLAATVAEIDNRPAMLFLTGDQIYADDVAGPLLRHLTAMGDELTGWQEALPAPFHDVRNLDLYRRGKLILDAGFSTGHGDNHIALFGEFAALYLVAWSPEGWRPTALPADPQDDLTEAQIDVYQAALGPLATAREDSVAVRRVHANIPVLTIFDDHEVTDDWNITADWQQRVYQDSPLCRRVVANGLASYWAFQGWGNDPEAFSDTFIATLAQHFADEAPAGGSSPVESPFEQLLWNFHGWSYALPTIPAVIALDTRTQRSYDTEAGPPRLLGQQGLDNLRTLWAQSALTSGSTVILLAPAPIFGFDPIEDAQKAATVALSVEDLDLESWVGNRNGFGAFMTVLNNELQPSLCIVLSGDVHYSFTNDADFYSHGRGVRVAQLVASALKNEMGPDGVVTTLGDIATKLETRVGAIPSLIAGEGSSGHLTAKLLEHDAQRWVGPEQTAGREYWYDRVLSCEANSGDYIMTTAAFGAVQLRFDDTEMDGVDGPAITQIDHSLHPAPGAATPAITFTLDGHHRSWLAAED